MYVQFREQVEEVEISKDGLLSYRTILWTVSVCGKNPDRKKILMQIFYYWYAWRNLGSDFMNPCRNRSSHRRCPVRKSVLRNFAKFTGKHLCQSFFFNKVPGLRTATLLKKRPWHRCFPVNFAKLLRTPFYRTPLDDCFWTFSSQEKLTKSKWRLVRFLDALNYILWN